MKSIRPCVCLNLILWLALCHAPGCAGKHFPRGFYMYPEPAGIRFFPEDDFPLGAPMTFRQQPATQHVILPAAHVTGDESRLQLLQLR